MLAAKSPASLSRPCCSSTLGEPSTKEKPYLLSCQRDKGKKPISTGMGSMKGKGARLGAQGPRPIRAESRG